MADIYASSSVLSAGESIQNLSISDIKCTGCVVKVQSSLLNYSQ